MDAVVKNIKGEFAASVDALNRHLIDFPIDYNIRGMLLLALVASEDYEAASAVAKELIDRNAFVADAYAALAYSAAGMSDYDSAITLMQKVVSIDDTPDNRKWLATWHMEVGDLESAIDIFQGTLATHPDHVGSLLGRAMLLALVYPLDGPEIATILPGIKDLAARAPDDAYVQFVLGQTALLAEPDIAIEAHKKAMALDQEEYEAHGKAMISTIYFRRSEYGRAIQSLKEALALAPEMANWRLMLSRYYLLSQEYLASLEVLAPLIDENVEEALYLGVQNYLFLNDANAVVNLSRALTKINENEPSYYMDLARGLAALGNASGATRALDQAANIDRADTTLQESVDEVRQILGLTP